MSQREVGRVAATSVSRLALAILLLLEFITVLLVARKLYEIFVVDGGFIFGDVTNHYFPAATAIINGDSPYISPFITHPPLMLLLFAAIVLVYPEPYSIGVLILSTYFLLPPLVFVTARHYVGEELSVLASCVTTLNPLTVYGFVTLIDDDPLIMLGLLAIINLHPKHRLASYLTGAILGGFKFVPLLAVLFLTLLDKDVTKSRRCVLMSLQVLVFSSIMMVGFVLWGPDTFTRLFHYCSYVGIDKPAMNPYYVSHEVLGLPEPTLRIMSAVVAACVICIYLAFRWENRVRSDYRTMLDVFTICLAVYLGNVETSYMYYCWVVPLAAIIVVARLKEGRRLLFAFALLAFLALGYVTSEWANYTWTYDDSFLTWAFVTSCFAPVFLFYILLMGSTSRPQSMQNTDMICE